MVIFGTEQQLVDVDGWLIKHSRVLDWASAENASTNPDDLRGKLLRAYALYLQLRQI